MTRPAKTPAARAGDVRIAFSTLRVRLAAAEDASAKYGHDSPESRSAWEFVEMDGATIHRQSRILAGKRRGG